MHCVEVKSRSRCSTDRTFTACLTVKRTSLCYREVTERQWLYGKPWRCRRCSEYTNGSLFITFLFTCMLICAVTSMLDSVCITAMVLFTMYYESMYECSSPDASAHLVLFWTVFAQMRLIIVYVITPLRGIFPVQGCNNEFISGWSHTRHVCMRSVWTLQLASLASSLACLHATKLPRKLARVARHCQEGNE